MTWGQADDQRVSSIAIFEIHLGRRQLICVGQFSNSWLLRPVGFIRRKKERDKAAGSAILSNLPFVHRPIFRDIPENNNGKEYSAPYDKPHNISVVLSYVLTKKWEFSTNWVYSSPLPVNLGLGAGKTINLEAKVIDSNIPIINTITYLRTIS